MADSYPSLSWGPIVDAGLGFRAPMYMSLCMRGADGRVGWRLPGGPQCYLESEIRRIAQRMGYEAKPGTYTPPRAPEVAR